MLVFLLLIVTSALCYYLGVLSIVIAVLSLLWKLAMAVILTGAVLLIGRRYRVRRLS